MKLNKNHGVAEYKPEEEAITLNPTFQLGWIDGKLYQMWEDGHGYEEWREIPKLEREEL